MKNYNLTGENPTDLSRRAARALTEKMTVLPDTGRVKDAPDLYLVVSESGTEYLVDARVGVCECPDYEHREPEEGCKHIQRVDYATGTTPIPNWVNPAEIDSQIGEQTDATVVFPPTPSSDQELETETSPEQPLQTDGGRTTESEDSEACPNGDARCNGPDGDGLPCFPCFEVADND
jgi:predicted nucleic acid-binding Zn finger protein